MTILFAGWRANPAHHRSNPNEPWWAEF